MLRRPKHSKIEVVAPEDEVIFKNGIVRNGLYVL
jgi:hypothetical protein